MNSSKLAFTAVILAGGKSSRMGRDKALLKIKERTVLEDLTRLTTRLFDETLIIVNDKDKLKGQDLGFVKIYEDLIKERGPLAGIYTGLSYSCNIASCIFTCDMPFIDETIIRNLVDAWEENCDVTCLQNAEGYHEPFPGIYQRRSRGLIQSLLEKGSISICRYLEIASAHFLPIPHGRETVLTNMNTPEEYQEVIASQRRSNLVAEIASSPFNVVQDSSQ